MQCPNCHEEVLLAEVCPYCGVAIPEQQADPLPQEETKGVFVGRLDGQQVRPEPEPRPAMRTPRAKGRPGVFSLIRYFFDPQVPSGRKFAIVGLLLYILSPIDLISDFLPVLGWVDDLAVGTFLWSFISHELTRYRKDA